MLVLTRLENEEIVIRTPKGEDIVVRVTSIRGNKVRLGIAAPIAYAVHRREVLTAIDRESKR